MELLFSAFAVFVIFVVFTFPLRLIIYYSRSFRLAITSRKIADWILLFLTVLAALSTATIFLRVPMQEGDTVFSKYILPTAGTFFTIVPYYYILSYLVGRRPFYTKQHIKYMDYFSLYLRRFDDDAKHRETRLTKTVSRWFPLFAIGRPDEFMPPKGAKRIYVDNDWKRVITRLIRHARIIVHQVNVSENYMWEFCQCQKQGFMRKSLFWVTDYDEYELFREKIADEFGLGFPRLMHANCDAVFYFRQDYSVRIFYLTSKSVYKEFQAAYEADHQEIFEPCRDYMYGRKHIWSGMLMPWPDKKIMPGVQKWSWLAFLVPEFYIICHKVKYRVWFMTLMLLWGAYWVNNAASVELLPIRVGVPRLILMFLLARNGRKLVWLSHRWEGVEYYNKEMKLGDIGTTILAVLYGLFWLAAGIYLQIIGWS